MKKIAVGAALIALSSQAWSEEHTEICVKQHTSQGDGQAYKVQGVLLSGQELNAATKGLRYNGLDQYAVIFWDEHRASIIDVGAFPLNVYQVSGVDQEGRSWTVSKSTGFCY